MKRMLLAFALSVMLVGFAPIQDNEAELTLSLRRDFGYGGFNNDIQGTFTLTAVGSDDLVSVEFFIDEELMGSDNEAPFRIQFQTDNYEPGRHVLSAVGTYANGETKNSTTLTREFVSGEEIGDIMSNMVLPIIGAVLVIAFLSALVPMITGRGKPFELGKYGVAGGAVCPRCTFPYPRQVLAPNLVFGKLQRCPHCGKWAIVRAASRDKLAAAEERYRADSGAEQKVASESDRLQQALDDSRFDD